MTMDLLFILLSRFFSFLFHCQSFERTWLYIWVTRWVSYKKQEVLALRVHLNSPKVFDGVRVANTFSFLSCIFCSVFLRLVYSMLPIWIVHSWLPLRFCVTFSSNFPWCFMQNDIYVHAFFLFFSSHLNEVRVSCCLFLCFLCSVFRALFVLLSISVWLLYCLSSFVLRLLIISLVCSNLSS